MFRKPLVSLLCFSGEGKPTLVRHRLLDSLGQEKRQRVVNATEKLLRSFGQLEPEIPEVTVEEKDDKAKAQSDSFVDPGGPLPPFLWTTR